VSIVSNWNNRNVHKVLVRKPEEKKLPGRPSRRWEDNRLDLEEMGLEDVDWIHLTLDRDQWWALVNTVINRRVT